jgi:hypothetical protein
VFRGKNLVPIPHRFAVAHDALVLHDPLNNAAM